MECGVIVSTSDWHQHSLFVFSIQACACVRVALPCAGASLGSGHWGSLNGVSEHGNAIWVRQHLIVVLRCVLASPSVSGTSCFPVCQFCLNLIKQRIIRRWAT
jgi:hypothetical protein